MLKKDLIDALKVKSPCSESWEEMEGNDKVRFCSHCAQSVNNVSAMTQKEALRLVRRSQGRLCIQYITLPGTNKPLFFEQLHKITRRAPGLAAGVMSASISLSTAAYAQSEAPAQDQPVIVEQSLTRDTAKETQSEKAAGTARVFGIVADQNGALVPSIPVSLINEKSGATLTTVTGEDGSYEIREIPGGTYLLRFEGIRGFRNHEVRGLTVSDGETTQQNAALGMGQVMVLGGGMIAAELPALKNALSKAVDDDDADEVMKLITRHADVNAKEKSRSGITPLFLAVENGNVEIAEILIRFGARVNVRSSDRQTPLMRLDNDATPALVELLVKNGARLDLTDIEGNTALIIAADDAGAPVVKALIKAGAELNHQNGEGETALMKAAYNDDLETVRALIQAGADVNLKNAEGETAWDMASDDEILQLLESHGGVSGLPDEETEETDEPASEDPAPAPADSK